MATALVNVCKACNVTVPGSYGAWRDDLSPFGGQAKDIYGLIIAYADLRLCPAPSMLFDDEDLIDDREELEWEPPFKYICLWLMFPNTATCVLGETAWLQGESGTDARSIRCMPGLYYVYHNHPQLCRKATLVLHSEYALMSEFPVAFEEHSVTGTTGPDDCTVYLLETKFLGRRFYVLDRLVADGKGAQFSTGGDTGGSWTLYVTKRDHRVFAAYLHQ